MDDVRLVKLLKEAKTAMDNDPHLKGHPQVAIQHRRRHLSTFWRLLYDAGKL